MVGALLGVIILLFLLWCSYQGANATRLRAERESQKAKDENVQALFAAMRKNSIDDVRYILENKGVSVNDKREVGRTALHIAAISPNVNAEMLKLIISQGADVNARDNDEKTALDLATDKVTDPNMGAELLEFLIAMGDDDEDEENYDGKYDKEIELALATYKEKVVILQNHLKYSGNPINEQIHSSIGNTQPPPVVAATPPMPSNTTVPSTPSADSEAPPPASSDTTAPKKSLWYYYDTNGDKISATVAELKALAQRGVITPGTTIENAEGKTAIAKKVKGLFPNYP